MNLHEKILGVSKKCFYAVVLVCTFGILLGALYRTTTHERS